MGATPGVAIGTIVQLNGDFIAHPPPLSPLVNFGHR